MHHTLYKEERGHFTLHPVPERSSCPEHYSTLAGYVAKTEQFLNHKELKAVLDAAKKQHEDPKNTKTLAALEGEAVMAALDVNYLLDILEDLKAELGTELFKLALRCSPVYDHRQNTKDMLHEPLREFPCFRNFGPPLKIDDLVAKLPGSKEEKKGFGGDLVLGPVTMAPFYITTEPVAPVGAAVPAHLRWRPPNRRPLANHANPAPPGAVNPPPVVLV